MASSPPPMHGWGQEYLVPPNTLEIRLMVGIVHDADHIQFQIDVTDPSTKTLLAMRSIGHRSLGDHQVALTRMIDELKDIIDTHTSPF